ncbi:MAG TPA: Flp pilus assembly protein CpaB [Alphaproteobacteria bacterium]|nr:Flp pilus assembly protein CpaB [Alphaproteobacteria bacterium]
MRPISAMIFAFALAFAAFVFFVVPKFMVKRPEPVAPAQIASNDVLVAAHDLPAGMILKGDDVRWRRWPQEGLDPNFLLRDKGADPQKDAVGRVVLRGLAAGEPITAQRLLKPGDAGFLAAALTAGMRAVSVRIDAVSGDGGFIIPGDHVDVLLAEKFPLMDGGGNEAAPGGPRVTQKQVNSIVLRDVRVLAIDQSAQDMDNKPKVGSTATVEVTITQAQKLSLAAQMGTLFLALRSLTKADPPESAGDIVQDVDVSPYLGRVAHGSDGNGMIHVYHGASLALGSGR